MQEARLFVDWSFWVQSGGGSKKKKRGQPNMTKDQKMI